MKIFQAAAGICVLPCVSLPLDVAEQHDKDSWPQGQVVWRGRFHLRDVPARPVQVQDGETGQGHCSASYPQSIWYSRLL